MHSEGFRIRKSYIQFSALLTTTYSSLDPIIFRTLCTNYVSAAHSPHASHPTHSKTASPHDSDKLHYSPHKLPEAADSSSDSAHYTPVALAQHVHLVVATAAAAAAGRTWPMGWVIQSPDW